MEASRLRPAELAKHLAGEPPEVRRLVLAVRRMVLHAAPTAAESIKFGSLCYYRPGTPFGSIGGNICMIEVRTGEVVLSFMHGASLEDPNHLLAGRAKAKRFVSIPSRESVRDRRLMKLISAAAERTRRQKSEQANGSRTPATARDRRP